MPEEINRIVTDRVADLLWTPSKDADENLLREGVSPDAIDCVGNIMIDSFELVRDRIRAARMREKLGLNGTDYGVVTLHRPVNVDVTSTLSTIILELATISRDLSLVFPVHPRTRQRLLEAGFPEQLENGHNLKLSGADGLYRVHESRVRRQTGHYGFGRASRRDHLSKHSLSDASRFDGAPNHNHPWNQ